MDCSIRLFKSINLIGIDKALSLNNGTVSGGNPPYLRSGGDSSAGGDAPFGDGAVVQISPVFNLRASAIDVAADFRCGTSSLQVFSS